jgi:predicted nucleic acid-binding protein
MSRYEPKSYLIDSNIIVYAINSKSSQHKKAHQVFKRIKLGEFVGIISHQNLLESFRILTHKKYDNPMPTAKAIAYLESYASLCKIISPDLSTFSIAKHFVRKCKLKSDQIYDAYLAATMKTNSITRIITANAKDFTIFKEFEVLDPLSD